MIVRFDMPVGIGDIIFSVGVIVVRAKGMACQEMAGVLAGDARTEDHVLAGTPAVTLLRGC